MTTYHYLKLALTFHIVGIVMSAGTLVAHYAIYQQFWKKYFVDREKSMNILQASSVLSKIAGIGMLILITSGITMMILTKGVYMKVLWFELKLATLGLLIINGLFVVLRMGRRLKRLLSAHDSVWDDPKIQSTKRILNASIVLQLLLFIIIFVLASFRFT